MALSGSQKAYTYALSGIARSGATRSGYTTSYTYIGIGGATAQQDVQLDSLTITDELNETPNTCTFRLIGRTVTPGTAVSIMFGSQNGTRLFAGHVLSTNQSYWEKPANLHQDVACIDYTWLFGFVKVTKAYGALSATMIATDLIVSYAGANGFSPTYIAPNLPVIPEMTFTQENLGDALSRVAARIGGYWYVDYNRAVHLFLGHDGTAAPLPLTPTHRSLANVQYTTDLSQTLSRVYVEGRGTKVLSAVSIGETRIPVEAVDMFAVVSDVFAKLSFQGSSGGAQHLTYTGIVPGGGGTLVGPGALPSAAPTAAPVAGSGVTTGSHAYAVTFTTAGGESLPGPTTTAYAGLTPPAPELTLSNVGGSAGIIIGSWQVKITWFINGVETLASLASNAATNSTALPSLHITLPIGPAGTTKRRVYFKEPGGPGTYRAWRAEFDILNNTLTAYDFGAQMNGPLIAEPGGASTNQVNLSNIPIGNASVTGRKVYRTAANTTTPLKLLTTIANNTATTYTDTSADGVLGANAPASDTSGLQQPSGQVMAGSTTIVVAGTSAFDAAGGWAIIGNGEQVIRFTGISGNTLTGIPASGIGSILASIAYNSTITAAPMLTGIPASGARAILYPLTAGDELYLVVQVDDTARQAQLAALVTGTGIREEWIQDRRLSITEARARGNATLALRTLNEVRLSYTSRDLSTHAGADIEVNLPAPTNLSGTFKIQHVILSNFRPYPDQFPTCSVQASSTRFSFKDLLRVATRDVTR